MGQCRAGGTGCCCQIDEIGGWGGSPCQSLLPAVQYVGGWVWCVSCPLVVVVCVCVVCVCVGILHPVGGEGIWGVCDSGVWVRVLLCLCVCVYCEGGVGGVIWLSDMGVR